MTKKPPKSKSKTSLGNAELHRIWHAAYHVALYENAGGPLDDQIRDGIAAFLGDAIETASAALLDSKEDLTPLILRAHGSLAAAAEVLTSLDDRLDGAPSEKKEARAWQAHLVRNAVGILRRFQPKAEVPVLPASQDYVPYSAKRAADLEEPDPSKLWMIECLWQRSAAGIIGGGAKGCKTWLALDMALSVASGTPALDRFAVHQTGSVLYVNAEGGEAYVKDRLNALCAHRALDLDSLPHEIHVIPTAIRIDTPEGIGRLKATLDALRPTLLVLDPLVRLHRGDENSASTVSNLLSSLSELQQAFDLSIILVHHSTKQGARRAEMNGQDFRGSGDFHAWGSSNLAIRRGKGTNRFVVSAEHRAAPSSEKWTLRATSDEHPRLEIVIGERADASPDAEQNNSRDKMDSDIFELLKAEPQSGRSVRLKVPGGTERILESLKRLEAQEKITKVGKNWTVANGSSSRP